jgi:hypothetical protein
MTYRYNNNCNDQRLYDIEVKLEDILVQLQRQQQKQLQFQDQLQEQLQKQLQRQNQDQNQDQAQRQMQEDTDTVTVQDLGNNNGNPTINIYNDNLVIFIILIVIFNGGSGGLVVPGGSANKEINIQALMEMAKQLKSMM